MKRLIFLHFLLTSLIYINACNVTNDKTFENEVELINQMGENIFFSVLDEETASLIDIKGFIDPDEVKSPLLLTNESVKIDLTEIEGFQIDKLDLGIHIILYVIRDDIPEYPKPTAVAHIYGNISYAELIINQGKVILKNR